MKSEMKYEEEEIFLRTVVGHGLERDDLRDEIYVAPIIFILKQVFDSVRTILRQICVKK